MTQSWLPIYHLEQTLPPATLYEPVWTDHKIGPRRHRYRWNAYRKDLENPQISVAMVVIEKVCPDVCPYFRYSTEKVAQFLTLKSIEFT